MLFQIFETVRTIEQGKVSQIIDVAFRPLLKAPKDFASGGAALAWGAEKFPLLGHRLAAEEATR